MRVSTVPTTVPAKERYSAILGVLLMGLLHATVCCIHVCMDMKRRWAKDQGETSGLVGYRFRNEISVPADHQATENAVPT